MKYRMVRENRPMLKNYGRWKAVAVHENEVGTARIVKEVCRRAGASRGTVIAVLTELAGVVADHLRAGDSVRLDDVGLLKLEIESRKVDEAGEFRAEEHIRGVRLHVLPECRHGHPVLYQGIKFFEVGRNKTKTRQTRVLGEYSYQFKRDDVQTTAGLAGWPSAVAVRGPCCLQSRRSSRR
ncbi:MAG: hypothetical protein J5506_01230 [Prevotella sp.]|nr:hypothetical protein [Prevotella sp.]